MDACEKKYFDERGNSCLGSSRPTAEAVGCSRKAVHEGVGCSRRRGRFTKPWAVNGLCCYWTGLDCARPPGAVVERTSASLGDRRLSSKVPASATLGTPRLRSPQVGYARHSPLRVPSHAIQILKRVLESGDKRFFAFAQPYAWIVIFLVGLICTVWVTDL